MVGQSNPGEKSLQEQKQGCPDLGQMEVTKIRQEKNKGNHSLEQRLQVRWQLHDEDEYPKK